MRSQPMPPTLTQTNKRGADTLISAILPSAEWLKEQQKAVDLLMDIEETEGTGSAARHARQTLSTMSPWTEQIYGAATCLSQGEESSIRIAVSEKDYRSHKGEFTQHVAMLSKIVQFISPGIGSVPSYPSDVSTRSAKRSRIGLSSSVPTSNLDYTVDIAHFNRLYNFLETQGLASDGEVGDILS